jgi:hypothetical protein
MKARGPDGIMSEGHSYDRSYLQTSRNHIGP